MKTLFLIPIFFCSLLFAQDQTNTWYVGIQLGTGIAGSTLSDHSITGMNGGLTVGRRVVKSLWIESGIQLNRIGELESLSPVAPSLRYYLIRELDYLNIPLLAKVYTKGDKFRVFGLLGSQINFLQKWNHRAEIINNDGRVEEVPGPIIEIIHYSSPTVSFMGGFGLSFSLGNKLSLEGRVFTQKDIAIMGKSWSKQRLYYLAGNFGAIIKL